MIVNANAEQLEMRPFHFLLALLLCTSLKTQSQALTFKLEDVTVKQLLDFLRKQTTYNFFYQEDDLKKTKRLTLAVKNASVSDILDEAFKDQPLAYKFFNQTIRITYNSRVASVSTTESEKKFRALRGRISAVDGVGLPSTNIQVAGTRYSFVTDENGEFRIKIPEQAKQLVISNVSFESQVVPIGDSSNIVVVLQSRLDLSRDSVIVIGYGSTKKSDLTGSISSVPARAIGDRQLSGIGAMLAGKIPGLDVSGNVIRIRGTTSFTFTEPLIVIDGFLGVSLSNVNPNDIAHIEVLKDASSTAIYGARGANGVILITTKAGKEGPLKFNVNSFTGIAMTTKKLEVLNAAEFNEYAFETFKNRMLPAPLKFSDPNLLIDRTNWQNEVFQTGRISELNVDFSGGGDRSTYFFSAGYRQDESFVIGPRSADIYLRNRNEFKLRKYFRAGNNVAFSYKDLQGAAPWDVKGVVTMPSYFTVMDPLNPAIYTQVSRGNDLVESRNPVALSALTHPKTTTLGYNANVWAELEPVSGLIYRIQAGISGNSSLTKIWNDQYINDAGNSIENNYSETSAYTFNPIIETYLTYRKKSKLHDFSIMAGNSWQDGAEQGSTGIMGRDYTLTEVRNIFNARTRAITQFKYAKQSFLSYFGRINYQLDNRYLLSFNIRRDGSPRFAPSHRWASFPSVALGWKLHETRLIKDLNVFNELKLRASVGAAGNDGIGEFRYTSPVWTNGVYYPFGTAQTLVSGATVIDNSSMNIRWESTISRTIGLDLSLWNNALEFTTEYFIKNSKDILFTVPRPASMGYGIPPYGNGDAIVNAASCVNRGIEFQIRYRGSAGKFRYSINGNVTAIQNEVTSLGLGQPYLSDVNRTAVGYPIGYFYGYVAEKVFMTRAELQAANESARKIAIRNNPNANIAEIYYQESSTAAGDIKFKDVNGDGKVTSADQTMIGNSIPKRQFGLFGSLKYGGFDLDLYLQGTGGYQIFYRGYEDTRGMKALQNQERYVLDRWKSENEPGNGKVPRAILGDPSQNNRPSSLMISDGDFFKVRQMSIGYCLPDKFSRRLDISSCRFYLAGSNLITISRYPEYEPEYSGPNLTRGADWLNFPINPKTVVLGLKLTL